MDISIPRVFFSYSIDVCHKVASASLWCISKTFWSIQIKVAQLAEENVGLKMKQRLLKHE